MMWMAMDIDKQVVTPTPILYCFCCTTSDLTYKINIIQGSLLSPISVHAILHIDKKLKS